MKSHYRCSRAKFRDGRGFFWVTNGKGGISPALWTAIGAGRRSPVRVAGLARRLGVVDDPLGKVERLQQAAPGLRGEDEAGGLGDRLAGERRGERGGLVRQRPEDERIEVDLRDVAAIGGVDGVDEQVGDVGVAERGRMDAVIAE